MANTKSKVNSSPRTGLLVNFLYLFSLISCMTGLAVGLYFSFRTSPEETLPDHDALATTFALFLGFAIGVFSWALAWLVRQRSESIFLQRGILRQLRDLQISEEQKESSDFTVSSLRESEHKLLEEILRELKELNIYLMLTDQQRGAKRLQKQSCMIEMLSEEISQAITAQQFDEAVEILARLSEELGDEPRIEELDQQISQARKMKLHAVMQEENQRASDLMAVARFEEAIGLAKNLQQQFPGTNEAEDLLQRVQREAQTFEAEQCRRLFEEINSAAEARQWKAALAAAHRLLENHTDSQEAQKARGMMPTLVDNARIEEVRELRDRILDMIERRRYSEAVDLADHVVENYPETTAAEELREQLPRLRQLANEKPTL